MSTLFHSENYGEYRSYLMSFGTDNKKAYSRLKRNLSAAVYSELTPRQLEAVELYYIRRLKMPEIAKRWGVTTSTVSRTLKRARTRLERSIRYGAKELLSEEAMEL